MFHFDREYAERLAAADPETERHFVSYFESLLQLKLRSRIRSSEERNDIIQETFIRVLQALRRGSIGDPERLGAFVNSVCTNLLFEFARRESVTSPSLEDNDPRSEADPEDAMLSLEKTMAVRRVLQDLPEKDRKLLAAVYLENRGKEDLCREMKVEPEYLRVLLHRAKSRFRSALLNRTAELSDRMVKEGGGG